MPVDLKAIANIYEKYNISDDEDALVSTWGMYEAEAHEQIRKKCTPARAAELIQASDELKAIIDKFVSEMGQQIESTTKKRKRVTSTHLPMRHTDALDQLLTINSNDFRKQKNNIIGTENNGELTIYKNNNEFTLTKIKNGTIAPRMLGVCTEMLLAYLLHVVTVTDARSKMIELNVSDYAALTGYDINEPKLRENFCQQIRNDLNALNSVKIKYKGGGNGVFVAGWDKLNNGSYVVEISEMALNELSKRNRPAFTKLPTCLFQLDKQGQSSFSIGYKLHIHYFNEQNKKAGTNSIISVKSLLAFAPAIKSVEEYENQERRHFKEDIKTPLERALNDVISVGYLKSWNYKRPGKAGEKLSQDTVNKMTFKEFQALNIEFCPVDDNANPLTVTH